MAKLEAKKSAPIPTPVEAAPFGPCTACGSPAYLRIDQIEYCAMCAPGGSSDDLEARWKAFLENNPLRIKP